MILGIGIDLVEIIRFTHWSGYTDQRLRKLFNQTEIDYCRAIPTKSAERFAARFAAKEAAYKALSTSCKQTVPPFMLFCNWVTITSSPHGPQCSIDWIALQEHYTIPHAATIYLSITHTQTTAGAVVVITT